MGLWKLNALNFMRTFLHYLHKNHLVSSRNEKNSPSNSHINEKFHLVILKLKYRLYYLWELLWGVIDSTICLRRSWYIKVIVMAMKPFPHSIFSTAKKFLLLFCLLFTSSRLSSHFPLPFFSCFLYAFLGIM